MHDIFHAQEARRAQVTTAAFSITTTGTILQRQHHPITSQPFSPFFFGFFLLHESHRPWDSSPWCHTRDGIPLTTTMDHKRDHKFWRARIGQRASTLMMATKQGSLVVSIDQPCDCKARAGRILSSQSRSGDFIGLVKNNLSLSKNLGKIPAPKVFARRLTGALYYYLSIADIRDITCVPPRSLLTSQFSYFSPKSFSFFFFFSRFSLQNTQHHGTMRLPRAWFAWSGRQWVRFQHVHFPACRVLGRFDRPLSRAPQGLPGQMQFPLPHPLITAQLRMGGYLPRPPDCLFKSHPETSTLFFSSYIERWKISRRPAMYCKVGTTVSRMSDKHT